MRITLAIENKLLDRAVQLTGINNINLLVKLGLEALVTKESNKKLVSLGGTEKELKMVYRRRPLKHK